MRWEEGKEVEDYEDQDDEEEEEEEKGYHEIGYKEFLREICMKEDYYSIMS